MPEGMDLKIASLLSAKRADTGAWEREIDEQVYRLYLPAPRLWQAGGLTPEEIKPVDKNARQC